MAKPDVAVVHGDRVQGGKWCAWLQTMHYRAAHLLSVEALEGFLTQQPCGVVILDLDTVPVDNQFFRALKKTFQDLHILAVSRLPYHPGLEEAMSSHIYACLAQPLDFDELTYWLKSISENLTNPSETASTIALSPAGGDP